VERLRSAAAAAGERGSSGKETTASKRRPNDRSRPDAFRHQRYEFKRAAAAVGCFVDGK